MKEKILKKTSDFLIREGCRKVTVDEIAAYNGVSKRTLYELFLDKNDIIEQTPLYCNDKPVNIIMKFSRVMMII